MRGVPEGFLRATARGGPPGSAGLAGGKARWWARSEERGGDGCARPEASRCGITPTKERTESADALDRRVGRALGPGEPGEAGDGECDGEEEVEAQAEDVVGGVDAQQFLEDAKRGVAGDVEREETGRADVAVVPKPDQRGGEREVPDDLVEEGGVGGVAGPGG